MEKKQKIKKIRINVRFFNKILFLTILVCLISYVATINDLSIKGFALQELKKEVKDLGEHNKELDLKITNLRSYNSLSDKIAKSNFVDGGDVEYFNLKEEAVAMK